jgi:hypothetical protein
MLNFSELRYGEVRIHRVLGSHDKSQLILSRFTARSHTSLLVILVIRVQPDTEGSNVEAGTESIKMSRPGSG